MQAYQVTVGDGGRVILSLPYSKGEHLEILVRRTDSEEEERQAWSRLALESFFKDDSEADAMYDHYDEWRNNIDSVK